MTEFDYLYDELLRRILSEGTEVENRTGINTIKIPSHTLEFDLNKEFPILTTKQMFYKQAIIEILWIWQMGSNNVKELQDRKVHIWDEWMVDEDGIYRIYEPTTEKYDPNKEIIVLDPLSAPINDPNAKLSSKIDDNGNVMTAKSIIEGKNIKEAKYYGLEYANTIGTAYGYIVNRYQHTKNLIETIKNNPNDRRMVKSLWQDEFLRTAVLPSCVWSTEWDVTKNKINLMVHQRSCDVPLGLPFNITQYATLLKMIAQVTDKEPGTITYSIKDAHIYVNQLKGIKKQLERLEKYNSFSKLNDNYLESLKETLLEQQKLFDKNSEEYKELDSNIRIIDMILNPTKPELILNPSIKDFFEFDRGGGGKDIKVKNYKHMGTIKFPVAQ